MSKPENSEPENFLARWSTRKLANRAQSTTPDSEHPPVDDKGAVETGPVAPAPQDRESPAEPFDPTSLPPLDSIGADTNIADFLRRDVPPDLTRAALRRAWTSDPAIKDFVGLVENGWDFNDPSAMAGFGPISAEEVARLAGKVLEALPGAVPQEESKDESKDQSKAEGAIEPRSQLASRSARSGNRIEVTPDTDPDTAERGGASNDAPQQNEPREKS